MLLNHKKVDRTRQLKLAIIIKGTELNKGQIFLRLTVDCTKIAFNINLSYLHSVWRTIPRVAPTPCSTHHRLLMWLKGEKKTSLNLDFQPCMQHSSYKISNSKSLMRQNDHNRLQLWPISSTTEITKPFKPQIFGALQYLAQMHQRTLEHS